METRTALAAMAALMAWAGCAPAEDRPLARSILAELIAIDTTDSVGDNTAASEAMARRLRTAGFPPEDVQVVVPEGAPKKGNLVARLRGSGGGAAGKPILFLAHLDVVEARRSDWTLDPFRLTEKDGYFYGRGTQDIKGEAALLVANFIRLKREGFRPARDFILALTADEEGGRGPNGVEWLLRHRRSLIDAEFCVNVDSGGGHERGGKPVLYAVQAAEKGYLSFYLRARNPGGHSSLPPRENAIYDLADALTRLRTLRFPVHLNDVTQPFFARSAELKTGQEAADYRGASQGDTAAADRLSERAYENALLRTTCVATMLAGGHADNALPQTAEATVNCRVLPGETQEQVMARLRETVGTRVEIAVKIPLRPNPASPPPPELQKRVEGVVQSMRPGLSVVPVMETGGTDAKPLRGTGIPTYGLAFMFTDLDDIRAHGQDERIAVAAFYDGLEFGYRLMREFGAR